MRKTLSLCLLIIFSAFSVDVMAENKSADLFITLLQEGELEFNRPKGFSELPLQDDFLLPYEKRMISGDGKIEVRYSVRPLSRIEIDYDDPHSSAPAPNDLFEMLFRSITEAMARDSHPISRAYLPMDAKKDFNAGWVSVAVFDVDTKTSKDFTQAMLIAIHQNNKADAYTLILTNDLQQEKMRLKALQHGLTFTSYETDAALSTVTE